MIRNPFKHLFFILIVVIFSSCTWLNNNTVATLSSNPTFLSLIFNKSDSIPALSTARFSLTWDADLKDSVIVNLDYVVKYKKGDGGTLELLDGTEVEVSPAKKEELMELLFQI